MIFYFTATGNSLYIAKQLSENPISIPQVRKGSSFKNDVIGIVCPVYCGELPKTVFEFIKSSKFETDYLFLILTYGMNESDSAEFTFKQCEKQGVRFDYIANIKMVDNYLPAFDMAQEKQIDKKIPEQLSRIISDIQNRKKGYPAATDAGKKLHKQVAVMNKVFPSANNGGSLRITDKCNGAERFARFAENVWGIEEKDTAEETALAGVEALADFIKEIGLPTTFTEMGISPDTDFRAVADSTNITAGCCKKLTHDEIYEILKECI